MNYQQTLDYLYSFLDSEAKLPRTPAEFNLPRTIALLRALGEPQRAFPSVVIAGTKGKGSTAALLEAIVRSSGLRTGLWTSPHSRLISLFWRSGWVDATTAPTPSRRCFR